MLFLDEFTEFLRDAVEGAAPTRMAGLPPWLLLPPLLRPRHDFAPIQQPALTFAADEVGESRLAIDLGRALLGHAEDLSDLGEADLPWLRHGSKARGWRVLPGCYKTADGWGC
jgi:hypothetical protein